MGSRLAIQYLFDYAATGSGLACETRVGQDHVHIILPQNWAVAVNVNIWTTFRHCSLML